MDRVDTIARLLEFTSRELLDGRGSNLGADTPLLEFGVLDSLSMVGLLCFIFGEFGFDMSAEVVVSDCFRSLEAISELICGLRSQGEASERAQGEFRKLVKLKEVNGIDSRKTNLEKFRSPHHLSVEGQQPTWRLPPALGNGLTSWPLIRQGV